MSVFLVCKDGNTVYKVGDAFVNDDCSEICECRSYADDDDDDYDDDDDEDDECDNDDDYEGEDDDDEDNYRRRRSIENDIFGKSAIICSPLCATGWQCPLRFVNGTNCFCRRSGCEKRK